jgi:glycosyltransferase involved in cell wall biosynthesis
MKIGFLIEYFYPVNGGAENNCFYLARELAKNHEVHVFTSDRKDNKIFKKEEIVEGIKIHRYKNICRYKYYLTFTPGFLNILKYDLDILHVHSFGFLWHDFIVLLKKFSRTRLVNTPHGPFMALPKYNFLESIFRNIIVFKEFFINKIYDVVIQVNPEQYKWIVKYGVSRSRIKYVPNGISENIFDKVYTNSFVGKYNLKNKFVVSYLGRIQKYKGLDQVIKILPKLDKKIVFLAMGRDEGDKKRLITLAKKLNIENRVIFTGEISDVDKLVGLDASEVFIFPSEWEAFGIVVLEAMARNNAIISTKTEGGNFLVGKDNGFLYDLGDLKVLREHIEVLFKNRKLRENMKKNNLEKSKEFLWENVAKDLEKVYLGFNNKYI